MSAGRGRGAAAALPPSSPAAVRGAMLPIPPGGDEFALGPASAARAPHPTHHAR